LLKEKKEVPSNRITAASFANATSQESSSSPLEMIEILVKCSFQIFAAI
jgi:hypothetical protein